jgi:hypothetical protein
MKNAHPEQSIANRRTPPTNPIPSLHLRLSAAPSVIPTGAARLYSSARFSGDGLRSGGTLATISISAPHDVTSLSSLITRYCRVHNLPFVFINLRIVFSATPLFSKTSALPPVISKSHLLKEYFNDPASR